MRMVPPDLQAHAKGIATSLAHCWRLTRGDGAVLGFTDHDEPITLEGMRFEAASGLAAGEAETALGLAAGTREVEGALSGAAITEEDIRAGRYDGARVETFLVNWQAPDQHMMLDVAELGEVRRGGGAFTAELRGIASRLDRRRGRIYRRRCDAALGDARCRVDLAAPGRTAEAELVEASDGGLTVSGLPAADRQGFVHGQLEWLSGAAIGLTQQIVGVAAAGAPGEALLQTLEAVRAPVAPGDRLRVVAGCDKSFATCRERYANQLNFRGFPHLPGTDAALGFAKKDGLHDGGPIVP